MNRIYQGRALKLELLSSSTPNEVEEEFDSIALDDPELSPLWKHHAIFQDAINYYLVALGALATTDASEGDRVIRDLRERLDASWLSFPRPVHSPTPLALRDSLSDWLNLKPDATLDQAFATILGEDSADPKTRTLALTLILAKCGGDSAIQQGGRAYLPRLCDANYTGSWDFDSTAASSAIGKEKLAEVLHGELTSADLVEIATNMELNWSGIKLTPGKYYNTEESRARVASAADHQINRVTSDDSVRFKAFLETYPDAVDRLTVLKGKSTLLPADFILPRNRRCNQDLLFSAILFMTFPDVFTAQLLALSVKAPSTEKKKEAEDGPDFSALGDDPVKLARGKRGYVFRAFTALPAWNPKNDGTPAWKEFDIAAFKEALKSLNQFRLKTEEREKSRQELITKRAYMLEESEILPAGLEKTEDVETLHRLKSDTRFSLAEKLESKLAKDIGQSIWQLNRGALRGFRDLAETWNKLYKAAKHEPKESDLIDAVKAYQRDDRNRRSIGSAPLFFTLCEKLFWPLWVEPTTEEETLRATDHRPINMLYAFCDLHILERDLDNAKGAIKLSPAEATHSRRLFMFSDLSGKSAVSYKGDSVTVSIASLSNKAVTERRAVIHFSAPRLRRDGLIGDGSSQWLQPMTAALGLELPEPEKAFKSAVSLMPDRDRKGNLRHLLNFPKTIDPTWIHDGIGRATLWKNSFNGSNDKNLHLHWPGTATTAAAKRAPWWAQKELLRNGFTILSNDLGQRTAGAWALLKVTAFDPRISENGTNRPVRNIGSDGTNQWFAEVIARGIYRLPGEDRIENRNDGTVGTEFSGKKGRISISDERDEALKIWKQLVVGEEGEPNQESPDEALANRSFPEENDQLIRLANRRLSRLNTFHRWSCFERRGDEDPQAQAKRKEKLLNELDGWTHPEVLRWRDILAQDDINGFRDAVAIGFNQLRTQLEKPLLNIADRAAPIRHHKWQWQIIESKDENTPRTGRLISSAPHTGKDKRKFRGQRGLSMARIEQLENLRRLFLRYNKAMDREPGTVVKFGRETRDREVGEPCQLLLEKIDQIKDQRVNQTAHLILAQALGLRLRTNHSDLPAARRQRDAHGEYEKIPNRSPVDFIVIEDLSRYLSSQGRAPSENSRLMKWSHRAVRDKIKMLAEQPFAISVVETQPAYSSRFHAITGVAGSRAREQHRLPEFLKNRFEEKAKGDAGRAFRELLDQFEQLEGINAARSKDRLPPALLLVPQPGGPIFVPAVSKPQDCQTITGILQADINAAINLGLRSIAAPERIDIHQRIRALKDTTAKTLGFRPRASEKDQANKREQAAYDVKDRITLKFSPSTPSQKLAQTAMPNFFHDPAGLGKFDQGKLHGEPITSSVALFHTLKNIEFERCVEINRERLKNIDPDDQISYD